MSAHNTISIESNLIKKLFSNVYFINGTAYAGKSTMVRHLADKHGGICCGENYHDELMPLIDVERQPNLSYFKTMSGWQEFVSRTPVEYERWIEGCSEEASDLEILKLIQLAGQGGRIFADTNISPARLWQISDYQHVAIMLCPQSMSVERFFERDDEEKRFILNVIKQCDNPEQVMDNYRKCLERVNSAEHYDALLHSGFFTYIRNEDSTVEEARRSIEQHFGLA